MGKLEVLIKDFNKEYKMNLLSVGLPIQDVPRIPFSSPRANYMLYGGIPRGRLVEFAGEENGGKTTTALDIVGNAQKLFKKEWEEEVEILTNSNKKPTKELQYKIDYLKDRGPKKVLYADCENSLDEEWATLLGVNIEELILLKPTAQSAEEIFEIILQMIETDELGLVVIDSLGVMLSAQAYEKTMEEKTYGGISMALTLFSKKVENLCSIYNCTLIGINQVREDMNSSYGALTTTGGRAWKHNCSVRLMFQKGDYIDEKGESLKRSAESPYGNQVMMNIAKTKICKPNRRVGFYTLLYTEGIDAISDLFETALKYELIIKSGSWFNLIDPSTGELLKDINEETIKIQGKANVVSYLKENKDYLDKLNTKINEFILN